MVSFETSTKCFLLFVFWGGLSCLLSSLLRYLVGCCPCLPEALVGPRQVRETATMWAAQQPRIPTVRRLLTQNHPLPYLPDLIHAATQRPRPSRLLSQTKDASHICITLWLIPYQLFISNPCEVRNTMETCKNVPNWDVFSSKMCFLGLPTARPPPPSPSPFQLLSGCC